jgi:hypothetical protein
METTQQESIALTSPLRHYHSMSVRFRMPLLLAQVDRIAFFDDSVSLQFGAAV